MLHFDTYCERASTALWLGEPLNVATNLAFLIAAALTFRRFTQVNRKGFDLLLLIILLAAIGLGSGLWHLLGVRWALLADLLPILLFINLYLLSTLRRVLRLPWGLVLPLWIAYLGSSLLVNVGFPAGTLNGSLTYVPAWLAFVLISSWLRYQQHPSTRTFSTALGVFTLSLLFRTIDQQVCAVFAVGSHFLWHMFNAMVLYLLLHGLICSVSLAEE